MAHACCKATWMNMTTGIGPPRILSVDFHLNLWVSTCWRPYIYKFFFVRCALCTLFCSFLLSSALCSASLMSLACFVLLVSCVWCMLFCSFRVLGVLFPSPLVQKDIFGKRSEECLASCETSTRSGLGCWGEINLNFGSQVWTFWSEKAVSSNDFSKNCCSSSYIFCMNYFKHHTFRFPVLIRRFTWFRTVSMNAMVAGG